MDVYSAINKVDACRATAYFARNKKFAELWTKIADTLVVKYLSDQPTHDGTVE